MGIKKHIPNAVTCLNLISGCASVYFAFTGKLEYSGLAIFAAALFDFLDGMTARLLHVKSELGKQLDSLCDVVSFGVAPGAIMYHLILLGNEAWKTNLPEWVAAIALILPVFSALRLAKFNIDTRQTDSFIGLPTPAMGLVIASFAVLIFRHFESPIFPFNDYVMFFVLHPATLLTFTITFAFLMVSPLPLFALKFNTWGWKENQLRFIFLISSVIVLLLFFFVAIPFLVLCYILISMILHWTKGKKAQVQS
jgi:CDP-diacylglycerol--serine O-phosphatidyltransferase